jgi:hypothetical protein
LIKVLSYRLGSFLMAILFFAITAYSQDEPSAADTVYQGVTIPLLEDGNNDTDDEENTSYYPDTLKQNFRSIVFDSVQAINTDKGFYYKRYLDSLLRATEIKQEKPVDLRGVGFFNSIFGIIFWIIAIGLFGYLVYRLFLSNSALFSRSRKNISSDIDTTLEEDANDIDSLLNNAIRNGNYRLAVRYLYLQVLGTLAERKLIQINTNKTNYEYVNEVRKHKFANEFASITLQYEYVWYGEYPVDQRLFEQIRGSFNQFNKNFTR